LSLAKELGEESQACEARIHLGLAVALTVDADKGVALVEQGLESARHGHFRILEIAGELHLARIALASYDPPGTFAYLKRCTVLVAKTPVPLYQRTITELEQKAAELRATLEEKTWT
jgi:hypothetical protein